MTRTLRRGLAVAVVVAAGASITAESAAAAGQDRAATGSLIAVMTKYYLAGTPLLHQSDSAGQAFVAEVTRDCPGLLDPSELSTSQLPVANALNLEAGFEPERHLPELGREDDRRHGRGPILQDEVAVPSPFVEPPDLPDDRHDTPGRTKSRRHLGQELGDGVGPGRRGCGNRNRARKHRPRF